MEQLHVHVYIYIYVCMNVYIYTFICIYACVCICMYIYIYIHTYIYLCIYLFIYLFIGTGEILVKGWHLLSEECLWFRKNAAHFEGSPNLKQYILHHVQGNAAFFSQKCCALLDMFFCTQRRYTLLLARFYQCAWYVERLFLKNVLHLLREETGLSWSSMYCIWQLTFLEGLLYVKGLNLKGNR